MWAPRASADVADVRLERKIRYDYAKLKARKKLKPQRTHHASAQHQNVSATPVAASPRQAEAANSPTLTTTGKKHHRQQADPAQDAQKRPRRMGNPAEGESQTPMNSTTRDTPATSPDTSFDHGGAFLQQTFNMELKSMNSRLKSLEESRIRVQGVSADDSPRDNADELGASALASIWDGSRYGSSMPT
ncbi:unnamed protein product [Peronospora effusa]|nr:unnamed protein product [Peronospora effusa]